MNKQITLRPYQEEAIKKILWAQQLDGNDLCVLPTGAGKSVVIAYLAKELKQPILILQPNKEILEQNYEKLMRYVDPKEIGIYSASMDQKIIKYYTFATIQSIYEKAEFFKHFKIVIIDECHLVNPKNLDGMFTKFLEKLGKPKVIGFTATPYRLDTMYTKSTNGNGWGENNLVVVTTIRLINRMKNLFWNRLIFNINNADLLAQGYLAPLSYLDFSLMEHEDIPVNKSLSDFDLEAYEQKLSDKEKSIVKTITIAQESHKSVLVFCSSVRQAIKLQSLTKGSEVVTAKTTKSERDRIIKDFKNNKIKTVFNMGVLTTGFDHPALDCIVLLRPTRSIALYYQMLGRGVRPCEGKENCTIIDLTSTVKNLGKIETIKLEKDTGKWELKSETGYWHNRQLYKMTIPLKKREEENVNTSSV